MGKRRSRALAEPETTQWTADQVAGLLDYLGRWRDRVRARKAAESDSEPDDQSVKINA